MRKRCDRSTVAHLPTDEAGRRERGYGISSLWQMPQPIAIVDDMDPLEEIRQATVWAGAAINEWFELIPSVNQKGSFVPRSPEDHLSRFRGHIRDYSLQSRRWRRLSAKLLPLLLREQDFESSIHLMEIMKTSSSLSDFLNKNSQFLESLDYEVAEALLRILDMLEGLWGRLALIFQHKYTSLKHTKSAAELIFEFPNNVRHIFLWGVCWMFIIGSQVVDHESLTPTFSPTPAADELFDASFNIDLQNSDPSTALFDFGDPDSVNSLFYNGAADHTTNPLDWANGSPLDPNFLTAGIVSDVSFDLNELGSIHGSVVEAQSSELLHGNNLPNPESSGRNGQKSKQRVICPTCQRSFAALFTIKRHQAYTHSNLIETQKTVFLCPNAGCKRSKDKYPFPRKDGLTRHLLKCKYKQNTSLGEGTPNTSQSSSVRCTDIPGSLGYHKDHDQEHVGHHVGQKRPRLENRDDGPDNERLLSDMMKKLRRLSDEVEKKERELAAAKNARDSFEKAILALKGS
ncbi:unnamed protein product [Fusarium equiseti]|uniref:C2H2-type domain-containing protein n=1 Tax=Fusarium equiseti TaxID=61235 RepID=A0A8J2J4A7_FUSEQ|nr:unnamed protein product [Fusarium equiseti]